MPTYKLEEGSIQHQFQESRAKIQLMGGAFANGKTTAGVIKGIQLAKAYPGSNGLIARSTYPKLNDTIRKVFYEWCPDKWIARKVLSQENVCELSNGSIINFRYIQQHGKGGEQSSSNLLSATYDWIVIDQLEDPEITEKDFLDLLGRLRGNAEYNGDDPTMPRTGPRWLMGLCNPSRNWVFRKLVKPLQDYQAGIPNPDLMQEDGEPIVELFEGSTYTNAKNLAPDYIKTLENTYKGQMRSRYLLGEWGAFEGLVYPQYDPLVHYVQEQVALDYLMKLILDGFAPTFLESYDHGMAKEACYGLAFVDHMGNIIEFDGFYLKEKRVDELAVLIKEARDKLQKITGPLEFTPVEADPAIFKRTPSGNNRTVGITVAGLFDDEGIDMMRASNDVVSGIAKVQSYLACDPTHFNPFTGEMNAPHIYFTNNLPWIDAEFTDYYWKKDTAGEYEDTPMDRRDHAMDRIKYSVTHRPRLATLIKPVEKVIPRRKRWTEREGSSSNNNTRRHRYAA